MATEKVEGGWVTEPYTVHTLDNGVETTSQGTSNSSFEYRRSVVTPTPGYWMMKRAGALIPHSPWDQYTHTGGITKSGTDRVVINSSGRTSWRSPRAPADEDGLYIRVTETMLQQYFSHFDDAPYFVQQAAAALYSRKRYDLLTSLAEFKSTLGLFQSLKDKIFLLVSRKPANAAGNLWLEGRYGWRTLAYDIQSLNDAIKGLQEDYDVLTERAGMTVSETVQAPGNKVGSSSVLDWTDTTVYRISVRGNVNARFNRIPIMWNPLITGWELVKFSVFIDWFISVGDALAALSLRTMSSEAVASAGLSVEGYREYSRVRSSKPGYSTVTDGVQTSSSVGTWLLRQPATIPLVPQVSPEPLNFSQLADLSIIALRALRGSLQDPRKRTSRGS